MKIIKVIKKMIIILLCACSFTVIGRASESYEASDDKFKSFVDPIYNENKDFKVINENGQEFTSKFISDTACYYYSKDYENIQQYLIDNNYIIEQDATSTIKTRAITNRLLKNYSKSIVFKDSKGKLGDKKTNIYYSISGSATCDNKGKIIGYNNAYLSKQPGEKKDIQDWEMRNASCTTTNKGSYLSIRAEFDPVYEYVYNGAGVATYKINEKIKRTLNWTPMY